MSSPAMSSFPVSSFSCPTKILFGVGAHEQLPDVLREWNATRLFVLLDPALADSVIFRRIEALLTGNGVALSVFTGIEPEPGDRTVQAAFERCREQDAQALLAIGGGSTIDVAKAVGILMTNGGRIADYEGIEKFAIRPLPLIAVPTTAGTGSEVSGACVITDTERKTKMAIRHAAFSPAQVAILDPLAVGSMPAHVAAHAGIDAFVHAFESYLSKRATVFSDAVNLHAMTLIAGSIRPFVADRTNVPAALDMLCGSALAAMSFGVTGLGNVHCMAMSVGALFPVPHGLANAVCLPYAAAFNAPAKPERMARVAGILGMDTAGLSQERAAEVAVDGLRTLCADLGIPPRLRDVGVTEDRLDEMARRSYAADYNRWNPRHTSEPDFQDLFRAAF
ncbi:iron-containing alcohol dehydrogenase (plasmid) [Azospirillum brasilense]|uniref:Alcohol dehydrogenase 2 n=1 Tax=Azospirillum brasilense TaxID=192 RepID=A0A4D8R583_AZOBR|nr:iron-containing alcohol dehydrogenase [Azospirillum brasilense]QCO16590.1 iron-containing alcohol dehydrogenase [Azospirillum brasilense]